MRKIYMDHNGACPVDPRVVKVMLPYFNEKFGNPSSLYSAGSQAKRSLEEARMKVANLVNAQDPRSIIFTSGATESNNLAIKGVALRYKEKGNHIITSAIEHMSVLNPCKDLMKQSFDVSIIPVDKEGFVDPQRIKREIRSETILISIMYANGEIGTIEPIREIGQIARENEVIFHTDATAACGKIPVDVEKDNIDLLTISSNDMYGPAGTGALYVRPGTRIQPIILGGGQEKGLRSGTENIASIVGLGEAAKIAQAEMDKESKRLRALRDKLIEGILNSIEESYLTGPRQNRLPHHASFRFSYIEGESIILNLDMMGVSAASGSACTSKTLEPSHVLIALGLRHEEAHGSLLLTLGRSNTEEDVDYVLEILPGIIKKLRAMSPLAPHSGEQ